METDSLKCENILSFISELRLKSANISSDWNWAQMLRKQGGRAVDSTPPVFIPALL